MPKYKIGDTVIYEGQCREGCEHQNEEVGKVVSTVNGACPYYLIEVLDWDRTPVYVTRYGAGYPLTWLAEEDMLRHWSL